MTRHLNTVLTIALTVAFLFALSLTALAGPYAPADVPQGPTYGSLPGGFVEEAGQPATVSPATASAPDAVADDGRTIVVVASIVTGLFLAAGLTGYATVTVRHRRAVHA